jgi:release factor glutamine methyltransferase
MPDDLPRPRSVAPSGAPATVREREDLTVSALVGELTAVLTQRGVAEARHEAREIVAALHDVPRSWPVANPHVIVEDAMRHRARVAAERRARGAPLAYAVGRACFRHLTLDVDERVLIPRPETEQLVDLVLDALHGPGGIAVDVGTGSGAIALALASEARFDRVIATDISLDALAVARENAQLLRDVLRSPLELVHGSLLTPLVAQQRRVTAIVSNPPYIAFGEAADLPASVRDWEPAVALFSGADGMWATARLVRDASVLLEPGGLLALEVDARRASLVAELVARDRRFSEVRVHLDLFGRERFVLARR